VSERERENLLSVVCGHGKTFDDLCHLACRDAKSESERAREQESKRKKARERARKIARERESERAREREKVREGPRVLGRNPIVSLLWTRERERERERENPSSSFVDT